MKVILFGATGMVGQGVLRECLKDPEIQNVLSIVRKASEPQNPKLKEIVHKDFFDFSSIKREFADCDACFFCLGVSSAGMKEADYSRITYDITLAAAETLVEQSPQMTFIYVSGSGTDSTEKGRSMWARVKGKTENALKSLCFKAVYLFRPGFIQPLHGIKSKTKIYRAAYAVVGPLYPLWKAIIPKHVTTTESVGRAMIKVAKRGAPKTYLENEDINRLCS